MRKMPPDEENAALRAENAALREQVQALVARVREVEGRLAKDSHNSSKPPTSDGPEARGRRTKSLRQKSGKKPGGQPGHAGHRVSLVATPDEVVEHRPARRGACPGELPAAAPSWVERRQVHELPVLQLRIVEHRVAHVRCPACGATTAAEAPVGAAAPRQYGPRLRAVAAYLVQQQFVPYARVRELLAEVFGAALAVGTLVNLVQAGASRLQPVEEEIKAALRQRPRCAKGRAAPRAGAASRRNGAARRGAGRARAGTVDARDLHERVGPRRAPRRPRGDGLGGHRHPARLHRRERA